MSNVNTRHRLHAVQRITAALWSGGDPRVGLGVRQVGRAYQQSVS